jgi:ElaB/YqjD/DUF883 family membrane-anchored ribosome-binding protein
MPQWGVFDGALGPHRNQTGTAVLFTNTFLSARDQQMTTSSQKSVNELREESERNREALASTVIELRERVGDTVSDIKTLVSPTHIKQEIRDYVRQERETLVDSLQRKVKENPLQMAAVAAAVGYPALGLLRALPAPLWLIGAGLFLTSSRGRQTARDVKEKVDDAVRQGTEQASDFAASIRSGLEDRIAGARFGVEAAQDKVSSTAGAMTDKARAAFHDARDVVIGATGNAAEAAGNIAAQSKATADGLGQRAAQTAQSVKDGALGAAATSRDTVANFVNDNALLVAGIGAAVGAFIAASIPASNAENRLFGARSEKLKDRAREAAAQGIERAGDIAADAAGAVATAAAREGLDASGVQGALGKVADSVRAVADRGLGTALGEPARPQSTTNQQQQPISERNPS